MKESLKILIYGYGNPGRQDDGLGVAIADFFESEAISGLRVDSNYQLNAEDAMGLSENDVVIFVDASVEEKVESFSFKELKPDNEIAFTTHAMTAGSVLALCEQIYKKKPDTYILGIRGFEWDFKECLSEKAKINFKKAKEFLKELLINPTREKFRENTALFII